MPSRRAYNCTPEQAPERAAHAADRAASAGSRPVARRAARPEPRRWRPQEPRRMRRHWLRRRRPRAQPRSETPRWSARARPRSKRSCRRSARARPRSKRSCRRCARRTTSPPRCAAGHSGCQHRHCSRARSLPPRNPADSTLQSRHCPERTPRGAQTEQCGLLRRRIARGPGCASGGRAHPSSLAFLADCWGIGFAGQLSWQIVDSHAQGGSACLRLQRAVLCAREIVSCGDACENSAPLLGRALRSSGLCWNDAAQVASELETAVRFRV